MQSGTGGGHWLVVGLTLSISGETFDTPHLVMIIARVPDLRLGIPPCRQPCCKHSALQLECYPSIGADLGPRERRRLAHKILAGQQAARLARVRLDGARYPARSLRRSTASSKALRT